MEMELKEKQLTLEALILLRATNEKIGITKNAKVIDQLIDNYAMDLADIKYEINNKFL